MIGPNRLDPDPRYVDGDDQVPPPSGLLAIVVGFLLGALIGSIVTIAVVNAAPRPAQLDMPPAGPPGAPSGEATSRTREVEPATTPDLVPQASGGAPFISPAADLSPPPAITEPPAVEGGIASFVDPVFGPRYLALPEGPGHRVRICGPAGCVTRISTDAGPDLAMQREGRIADLSFADFRRVCGCYPWAVGLVEIMLEDLGR